MFNKLFNKSIYSSSIISSSPSLLNSSFKSLIKLSSLNYSSSSSQFTKLITPVELRSRQKRLVESVFKNEIIGFDDYLILIPAAIRTFQTDTIIPNIHFKQNSDFIYFTGFNRIDTSECILALIANNGKIKEATLYSPTISENQSVWEGDGIRSNYNQQHTNNICDQILDISKLYNLLQYTFKGKYIFSTHYLQRYQQLNVHTNGSKLNCNLSNYIDKLRLIKSKEEMNAMRRTCKLGADALRKTIEWSSSKKQVNENQLACIFDYESRINGAVKMSYPVVCAGKDRATIIHYGSNSENLQASDWILMDAGCEDLDGYCSDITRCWEIGDANLNKKEKNFKLQYALHQALNELQTKLISSIEIGHTSLNSLFVEMCDGLLVILKDFGVIEKGLFKFGDSFNQIYPYCPHHVSHFLGSNLNDN